MLSSPASFCTPSTLRLLLSQREACRKEFSPWDFWQSISSFVLPSLEPASLLLMEGIWSFSATIPFSCTANHEEEFPVDCCSMLFDLPCVVLLACITEAFDMELCLHFLLSGSSFGRNPVLTFLHGKCGERAKIVPKWVLNKSDIFWHVQAIISLSPSLFWSRETRERGQRPGASESEWQGLDFC